MLSIMAANFFIGTAKLSIEPGTKGLADTASELAKRASGDLLARSEGVHVRRVEEVDSELDGPLEERWTGFVTRNSSVAALRRFEAAESSRARRSFE
jgi:hypothetical protein